MKTAFNVYLRAQLLYALFTLPALFSPAVYVISECLALAWGTVGFAVFLLIIATLRRAGLREKSAVIGIVAVAALGAAFLAAWLACRYTDGPKAPFAAMLEWWPFPLAALVAAGVSVGTYQRAIARSLGVDEPSLHTPTQSPHA